MSLRLEMLQVMRLAPRMLGDAAERCVAFLRARQHPSGGFTDRAGAPDIYYTVFGVESLFALGADLPTNFEKYVRQFDHPAEMDLVHLSCLARCWAALSMGGGASKSKLRGDEIPMIAEGGSPGSSPIGPGLPPSAIMEDARTDLRNAAIASPPEDMALAIIARVESFRSPDGGYGSSPGANAGSLYGCFLASGVYQDLRQPIPNIDGIVSCIQSLRSSDGGYSNSADMPQGLTPTTAAAVTLLRQFGASPDPLLADWLLARCHADGGFFATPSAPIPDLLSTATALHALSGLGADYRKIVEPTLDFLDTLWSSEGAFFGNWEDDLLDCEYLYYGLLSLGHLSV